MIVLVKMYGMGEFRRVGGWIELDKCEIRYVMRFEFDIGCLFICFGDLKFFIVCLVCYG